MKISELHIENIKRIKIVDIKTNGKNVVIIEGRNAQGKSSALDSIAYALGGEKLIPDEVVRKGEEKAVIQIRFEESEKTSREVQKMLEARRDGYLITRNWTTPVRSYLKVEDDKGMSPGAPQTWVDERIGKISFDPMKFLIMAKEEKIKELKKTTGLDLSEIDKKYQWAYEKRREVKREADRLKKEHFAYVTLKPPEEIRKREEVLAEMEEINKQNEETRNAKLEIDTLLYHTKNLETTIAEAENEIARLMKKIEESKAFMAKNIKTMEEKRVMAERAIISTDLLKNELKKIEEAAVIYARLERKVDLEKQIISADKNVYILEKEVSDILDEKDKMIAAVKMPIEGLEFDEETIRYNGFMLEEAALSEQIKVSMAIAMSQNPEIRVVLIHDGSLLDQNSKDEITRIAEEKDFQVWMECTAEGKGSAVYIEDGEVK